MEPGEGGGFCKDRHDILGIQNGGRNVFVGFASHFFILPTLMHIIGLLVLDMHTCTTDRTLSGKK